MNLGIFTDEKKKFECSLRKHSCIISWFIIIEDCLCFFLDFIKLFNLFNSSVFFSVESVGVKRIFFIFIDFYVVFQLLFIYLLLIDLIFENVCNYRGSYMLIVNLAHAKKGLFYSNLSPMTHVWYNTSLMKSLQAIISPLKWITNSTL